MTKKKANLGWGLICIYMRDNCPSLSSDRNAALVLWNDGDMSIVQWLGSSMPTSQDNREVFIYQFVREGDLDPCDVYRSETHDGDSNSCAENTGAMLDAWLDDHHDAFDRA